MSARDTSAESHALNDYTQDKARILGYIEDNGPCSRREIAERLEIATATVSGIVAPMVDSNTLYEIDKAPCRITGRKSLRLVVKEQKP